MESFHDLRVSVRFNNCVRLNDRVRGDGPLLLLTQQVERPNVLTGLKVGPQQSGEPMWTLTDEELTLSGDLIELFIRE